MNKDEKKKLRSLLLATRRKLELDYINSKSQLIAEQLFQNFNFSDKDLVHCFIPVLENGEVNTYFIIEELIENYESKVCIPVADFRTKKMTSCAYSLDTILVANKYKIREPKNQIAVDDKEITYVIAPLLAFDKNGYRLGYGGGFYDRFLATLDLLKVKVVGVSFDTSVEILPIDEYDIPMHACVTPDEVYHFNPH